MTPREQKELLHLSACEVNGKIMMAEYNEIIGFIGKIAGSIGYYLIKDGTLRSHKDIGDDDISIDEAKAILRAIIENTDVLSVNGNTRVAIIEACHSLDDVYKATCKLDGDTYEMVAKDICAIYTKMDKFIHDKVCHIDQSFEGFSITKNGLPVKVYENFILSKIVMNIHEKPVYGNWAECVCTSISPYTHPVGISYDERSVEFCKKELVYEHLNELSTLKKPYTIDATRLSDNLYKKDGAVFQVNATYEVIEPILIKVKGA